MNIKRPAFNVSKWYCSWSRRFIRHDIKNVVHRPVSNSVEFASHYWLIASSPELDSVGEKVF